jgi:integrase
MSYRYEKRLAGIGSVRRSTGLDDATEIEEFKGLVQSLAKTKPQLVRMFAAGDLSARELLLANREENLTTLVPDARVLMNLWEAFEHAWGGHRKAADPTIRRYRVSALKLLRLGPLPRRDGSAPALLVTVRDLERVDWDTVAEHWLGSPSDWMAFYRMLSTFLTLHFGGKRTGRAHPFRNQVLDLLPRMKEHKRVPEISPAVFLRLMAHVPEYVRPCYHTLVTTGFRAGEYLALAREHLRPDVFEIAVPGTKTEMSAGVIPVDPSLWPWIDAAVPSPVQYAWLRKHWARACLKEGLATLADNPFRPGMKRYSGPTLHDLRHCAGQWATNAGVPEAMVQAYLRHSDPTTTRRYTMQQIRGEVATAMAKVMRIA